MKRSFALIILASLLLLGMAPPLKSYSADRFDAELAVQPDGSLLVTETLALRFADGPFTFVYRDLPTNLTDGIGEIEAGMDGVVLPRGTNEGQIDLQGSNPLRVRWQFAPTANATHTFVLRYHVFGVVRQDADADVLAWIALPKDHEYAISSSVVHLSWPAKAALLGAPRVSAGNAAVEAAAQQASFTAGPIPAGTTFTIETRFQRGSLLAAPPQWQQQKAVTEQRAPYLIAAAILLFALALGGLAAFYFSQRPPSPIPFDDTQRPDHPPMDIAPALAGALADGSPNAKHALGTLFDLGQRGVLEIDEASEKHWYRSHTFLVRQVSFPDDLRPHEQALLDLLFQSKHGREDTLEMTDLGSRLASRWKVFDKPLQGEMDQAEFYSAERRAFRSKLVWLGTTVLLLSLAGVIAALLFLRSLGPWGITIPFALAAVAFFALLLAGTQPQFSDRGLAEAARWKGFQSYLRDVTKGRATLPRADAQETFLPFAASFGLAEQWAKYLKTQGTPVPDWFHAVSGTHAADSMGSFAAMAAASSASTASGGGAAAGAAGGGGSGAG